MFWVSASENFFSIELEIWSYREQDLHELFSRRHSAAFPSSMINDTSFKNYFPIFLIKFLARRRRRNKLNFTCQNRHYSKSASSCKLVSVCRGQQPKRRSWELKLTSWRMFRHLQYFIGFCFGSRRMSSMLSKWKVLASYRIRLEE